MPHRPRNRKTAKKRLRNAPEVPGNPYVCPSNTYDGMRQAPL